MKKLFTITIVVLFASLLMFTTGQTADVYTGIEAGSILTDGGSGHMAYAPFFEVNVKSADSYTNKLRTGYVQYRNANPEVAAIQLWEINQVTLTDKWMPYVAIGFGGQNEIKDGDDRLRGGAMVELGCKLFNKVPFGVGGKLLPVADKGDQVFVYGMLNLKLP